MKTELLKKYRKNRKTYNASDSLRFAKQKNNREYFDHFLGYESDYEGSFVDTEGQLQHLELSVVYEDSMASDLDYLGELSYDWEPDCISLESNHPDSLVGKPEYFIPANSYAAQYDGLRELHYGKHEADCLARKYTRQDCKRFMSYINGDWWHYHVNVKHKDEDGEIIESLLISGIESDTEEHLLDTANEVASELVGYHNHALARKI